MMNLPSRFDANMFAAPARPVPMYARERIARASAILLASGLLAGTGWADAESPPPTPYRLQMPAAAGPSPAKIEPAESYRTDAGYRLVPAAPPPAPVQPPADREVRPFAEEVSNAARESGVEPALVHAVIEIESAYRANAVSPKGALGLMQVMPATAQRYGVDNAADVRSNLRAGTRHLRTLIDMFGDRLDLVLAAYNAGEGAVRKYNNAIPPYAETRNYVPAVMRKYKPPKPQALPPLTVALQRDYMPGTRLEANALSLLED